MLIFSDLLKIGQKIPGFLSIRSHDDRRYNLSTEWKLWSTVCSKLSSCYWYLDVLCGVLSDCVVSHPGNLEGGGAFFIRVHTNTRSTVPYFVVCFRWQMWIPKQGIDFSNIWSWLDNIGANLHTCNVMILLPWIILNKCLYDRTANTDSLCMYLWLWKILKCHFSHYY